MTAACTYSIVVPCYRSGAWLEELVQRIQAVMQAQGEPFEILLVNDASPDDTTWPVIHELCQRDTALQGFDFLHNVGQLPAILCGLEHAQGQFVITMDDDFQHLPEDIPRLISAIKADPNLDCVVGGYESGKHGQLMRDLGTRILGRLNTALYGAPPTLQVSSFCILTRPLVAAVCASQTARPLLSALLLQNTHRIVNVAVRYQPRTRGESGYTIVRLLQIVWASIVSATSIPLRLIVLLGLASVSLSVFSGIAPRSGIVVFWGGLILIALGLIGEYVIDIRRAINATPLYHIRQRVGGRVKAAAPSATLAIR